MAVIDNTTNYTLLSGTNAADTIKSLGSSVTIDGGKGNDSITNGDVWTVYQKNYFVTHSGDNISINANAGNDSILNGGDNVTIRGGAGDDWIFNNGSNVTIDGGTGDDSIQNVTSSNATINGVSKAFNVLFVYNGGNDYIEGFDNTSALKIASGELDSVFNTNGSDYFITVGENVITLVGAAALEKVNIVTGKSKTVKFNVNANIIGTEGTDTIYNYIDGATINSGAGSDSIRNNCSNVSINAGKGNDTISNYASSVTIDGGKGDDYILNDFIYNKYGENVLFVYSGGNDTIDGLNSSSTVQIASGKMNSVVQSNGSDYFLTVGKNFVTLKGAAYRDKVNIVDAKGKAIDFTVRDITVKNEKNKRTLKGTADRDDIENRGNKVTIISANGDDTIWNNGENVSINAGDGKDSIRNYGDSVIIDGGAGNDSIKNDGLQVTISAKKGNDTIYNYHGDYAFIDTGSGDDSISNFGSNVTIDAGAGNDSIYNRDSSDVSISGGTGNDYISGGDGNMLYGYSMTIDGGKGNDTIQNGGKLVNGDEGDDYIYRWRSNATVNGGAGNDTITSDGYVYNNFSINGGSGNDLIHGTSSGGENVTIDGGAGNDTIISAGDNSTLTGGTGNDLISLQSYASLNVIEYTAGDGNDSIVGFNEDDTLRIAASKYSTKTSGDDIIVTVGKGKITLAGAASLSAVNIDFDKLLLVDDKTSSPVTVETDVKVIDGTKRTRAVKITGNALNNSIVGGSDKDTLKGRDGNDSLVGGSGADKLYGEAGKDTLWGGAGNDTLYGGEGDDVFIYRADEGKDTIMDFTGGDLLQILKADGSQGTFTNSSFKSSNLTLAIDGGGQVIFSGVSADDSFNINGTTYSISGTKLK